MQCRPPGNNSGSAYLDLLVFEYFFDEKGPVVRQELQINKTWSHCRYFLLAFVKLSYALLIYILDQIREP